MGGLGDNVFSLGHLETSSRMFIYENREIDVTNIYIVTEAMGLDECIKHNSQS